MQHPVQNSKDWPTGGRRTRRYCPTPTKSRCIQLISKSLGWGLWHFLSSLRLLKGKWTIGFGHYKQLPVKILYLRMIEEISTKWRMRGSNGLLYVGGNSHSDGFMHSRQASS